MSATEPQSHQSARIGHVAVGVTAITLTVTAAVLGAWHWGDTASNLSNQSSQSATLAQTAANQTTTIEGPVSEESVSKETTPKTPAVTSTTEQPHTAGAVARTALLNGARLWIDTNNPAARQASTWRTSNPDQATLINKIATQPTSLWAGQWSSQSYVTQKLTQASSAARVPTLVLYNIPLTYCSGGGAASATSYKTWINSMSMAVGTKRVIVVVEPDALALISCLSATRQTERYALIKYVVDRFAASNPKAIVYLDAGHSNWVPAASMAARLNKSGVAKAQGFSLNVSNFGTTASNTTYGNAVSAAAGGARFVIDTSRNGKGRATNSAWCNPPGRGLGAKPSTVASGRRDALLWIKYPGESDSTCNGGPKAGQWWGAYALELARNASW